MTIRRILALAVTAVVLYVVAPTLVEVLEAWPRVRGIEPGWFAAMVAAQAGSLWCLAKLQALCMGVSSVGVVATSSLVSGALGRVLPGGTATAAAVQYRMLAHAGVPGEAIGVGLAAGTLLQLVALCALPVLALPAVVFGLAVPTTLATTALAAGGILVSMVALTVLGLRSDRILTAAGRAISAIRRRLSRDDDGDGDLPDRLIAQRDSVIRLLGQRWKAALAVTAGRWLLDFLTLQAALAAIGADVSLALTLLAYAGAQLLAQVPVTPGGLGVVEAGMTASLAVAGASAGQAAIATLAYRLFSYWLLLPAGLVAWAIHLRRGGSAAIAEEARS